MLRQMWTCKECKTSRQWGYGVPEDPFLEPRLVCEGTCETETIHVFEGTSPEKNRLVREEETILV